jgi:hypothetical protein
LIDALKDSKYLKKKEDEKENLSGQFKCFQTLNGSEFIYK